VAGQVERVVERRYAQYGSQRQTPDQCHTPLARLSPVHRDDLAIDALSFLGSDAHRFHGTTGLAAGHVLRLATFQRQRLDQLVGARFHLRQQVVQDTRALAGRQLAGDLETALGGLDRVFQIGVGSLENLGHDFSGVGEPHFQHLVAAPPFPPHQKLVLFRHVVSCG